MQNSENMKYNKGGDSNKNMKLSKLLLTVRDTGVGISNEEVEKLFKLFG